MNPPTRIPTHRRRLALPLCMAAAFVLLSAAASPAQAQSRAKYYRHGHHYRPSGHHHRVVHHRYRVPRVHHHHFTPVRVRYHRPRYRPTFFPLESPYVVVHGPRIAARVVYYPAEAPPLYAPGYCPVGVHYHPYEVRGGFSVRIGF